MVKIRLITLILSVEEQKSEAHWPTVSNGRQTAAQCHGSEVHCTTKVCTHTVAEYHYSCVLRRLVGLGLPH